MRYREAQPIIVYERDGQIKNFTSMTKCMRHYNIKYEQLIKWLEREGPVLAGPRQGMTFLYGEVKEPITDDKAYLFTKLQELKDADIIC